MIVGPDVRPGVNMANSPLAYVMAEAVHKRRTMQHTPLQYWLRAMLAGALIAAVLSVSLQLGQVLARAGSPLYYAATAGFFGTALCAIIIGKAELFTSNVLYMSVGGLSRQFGPIAVLKSWLMVYFGNLAGVLLFVWLYAATGAPGQWPASHLLFEVVRHKVEPGFWPILAKGILCNWIICLAVWLPLRLENDMARMMLVMLLVFVFFFSGFEHSIANMAFFGLAAVAPASPGPGVAAVLHNLVPATLGNIVGGALGVAGLHYYLERDTLLPVGDAAPCGPATPARS